MEDVFAIQEEIAQNIVSRVVQRVRDDVEMAARRRRPEDMRTYDLFLQGNRLADVISAELQDRSQSLLERAIVVDPTFARAYSGLAYVYLDRSVDSGVGVLREVDDNRTQALRLTNSSFWSIP
ncbi:hypothetical protein [Rhizobium sp. PL01]|uniref:hypothetical protein n=1 Tax=Rhizobium sp. PL01 TaxID=3085631 RepID=UPI0029815D8D|nr:hypothetical protein [Rhizobium sp. PL01]MDW5317035.1 hypothetical protein [Rhizobium sp. PL01]